MSDTQTTSEKKVVKTVDEASTWFTENAEGSVTAVKEDGTEKVCSTFAEAEAFLKKDEAAAA